MSMMRTVNLLSPEPLLGAIPPGFGASGPPLLPTLDGAGKANFPSGLPEFASLVSAPPEAAETFAANRFAQALPGPVSGSVTVTNLAFESSAKPVVAPVIGMSVEAIIPAATVAPPVVESPVISVPEEAPVPPGKAAREGGVPAAVIVHDGAPGKPKDAPPGNARAVDAPGQKMQRLRVVDLVEDAPGPVGEEAGLPALEVPPSSPPVAVLPEPVEVAGPAVIAVPVPVLLAAAPVASAIVAAGLVQDFATEQQDVDNERSLPVLERPIGGLGLLAQAIDGEQRGKVSPRSGPSAEPPLVKSDPRPDAQIRPQSAANPPPERTNSTVILPALVGNGPVLAVVAHAAPVSSPVPVPLGLPNPVAHGPVALPEPRPAPRLALGEAMGERLGVAIAHRVRDGLDQLEVRMDPAELGRIHIRLQFDERGSLRALVSSDNPVVIEALRRDLPELARTLGEAGVRTDSQSFRFDGRGSGASGGGGSGFAGSENGSGGGPGGGSGQRGWSNGGQSGRQPDDPAHYRPARRNGRIDLMA